MLNVGIACVRAYPLNATWELIFGGKEKVPPHFFQPSSNFRYTPRRGQHSTLVEIVADDGTAGYGECFGIPDARYSAYYIEEYFAPMLLGKDPMEIESLWEMMLYCAAGIGNTAGPMMEAISGIDIALWDLKGKKLGQPVHALLGKQLQKDIYCYATPIMLFDSPSQTVDRAHELLEMGYTALKLKVGRGIRTDMQHIDAVRRSVPGSTKLLLDLNCGYEGRIPEAIQFAHAAEPYDIYWFEEPISPDDAEGYRKIRAQIPLKMATGENDFSFNSFKRIIDSHTIDYIMPNITRVGGITNLYKIGKYAAEKNVMLSPHGVGAGIGILAALQVMSVLPNAPIYEANQFLNPLRHEIMHNRIEHHDSYLSVSAAPGLGICVNWDTVKRFIAEGWSLYEHEGE